MESYKINGSVIEIKLESGKLVKVATAWAEKTMKALETDMEDVLLMWLEDEGYITNDEQDELDKKAKGVVKIINRAEKPKAKTQKERVQKENPTKELIIKTMAETLATLGVADLNIENKAKLITFSLNGEQFKLDLVQKRKPKQK